MLKSRLVDLLQHFTPDELQELSLFVTSPYFNRGAFSEEAILLLRFII